MSAADPSSNKKMASKSQKVNTADALKEKRRKFVKAKLPKTKPNPQSDAAPIVKQSSETEELYSTMSPWYENMERLKSIKPLDEAAKLDPKIMVQLKEKARNLYEERVKTFDRGNYFLNNLIVMYNLSGCQIWFRSHPNFRNLFQGSIYAEHKYISICECYVFL